MFKFVVDLEFTGLDPITNDVIEIALAALDVNNQVVDTFHSYVAPETINEKTWTIKAQEVHGITPHEARKFPERRKVCIDLLYFLAPFKCPNNYPREFICHALPDKFFKKIEKVWSWPYIDYFFLEWLYRKENLQYSFFKVFSQDKITSTITMARELTGQHRGHKLNKWAEIIGFPLDHHKAMSDTLCTVELYKYLTSRLSCLTLETTRPEELTL